MKRASKRSELKNELSSSRVPIKSKGNKSNKGTSKVPQKDSIQRKVPGTLQGTRDASFEPLIRVANFFTQT